jgi:hypothetical protein
MLRDLQLVRRPAATAATPDTPCEHRQVSADGRIICSKIVEGDGEVSPELCRTCPFRAVNCEHLRFSLRLSMPSPLIVRFNGQEEVWDDGPPALHFERAACAERVIPIYGAQACAECPLRSPCMDTQHEAPAATGRDGRVVRLAGREALAVAGSW